MPGDITERLKEDVVNDNKYLNPDAFELAPAQTFGNAPRILPGVRGPGRSQPGHGVEQGHSDEPQQQAGRAHRSDQPDQHAVLRRVCQPGVRQRAVQPGHDAGELLEADADHGSDTSGSENCLRRRWLTLAPPRRYDWYGGSEEPVPPTLLLLSSRKKDGERQLVPRTRRTRRTDVRPSGLWILDSTRACASPPIYLLYSPIIAALPRT